MKIHHKSLRSPRSLLPALTAALCAFGLLVACSESSDDGGAGGSGGTSAPDSGGTSGSSGGAAGAGSGGAPGGGEGGMGGGSGGSGGVPGSPLHGQVVDLAGVGVEGAQVLLEGKLYETAADGSFEAEDVPDTYDLVVLPAGSRSVSIWQNVTRRDPHAGVVMGREYSSVKISGRLSRDPDLPAVDGTTTQIGIDCVDGSQGALFRPLESENFEFDFVRVSRGSMSCRLLALEGIYQEEGSRVTGFASREVILERGADSLEGQNLELQAVSITEVPLHVDSVLVTAPLMTSITWGPFLAMAELKDFNSGPTVPELWEWTVQVPDVTIPIGAEVEVDGFRALKRGVGGGLVVLDMSHGISRMSPPDAASIAPGGEFSITVPPATPEGVYQFEYDLRSSGWWLTLHTTEEAFRLPDLSLLGVELSGDVTWTGTYSNNATSADALLGEEGAPLLDFSKTTWPQNFTFESTP